MIYAASADCSTILWAVSDMDRISASGLDFSNLPDRPDFILSQEEFGKQIFQEWIV